MNPGPLPPPAALTERLQITPREGEVLSLVASGMSNAEVAKALSIRLATVVKHLEHLYPKLGVTNRVGAAASAYTATMSLPPPPLAPAHARDAGSPPDEVRPPAIRPVPSATAAGTKRRSPKRTKPGARKRRSPAP